MTAVNGILEIGERNIWMFFLTLLRVGPLIFLLPVLGETVTPTRFRLIICIVVSVFLSLLIQIDPREHGLNHIIVSSLCEILIGLMLGFVIRSMFLALQIAGVIASQFLSLSQMLGASQADDSFLVLGRLYNWIGIGYVCVIGLPLECIMFIAKSYVYFPFGVLAAGFNPAEFVLSYFALAFQSSFEFSGAIFVAAVLYNITTGYVGRAMPQLMISIVSVPAIVLAGLFVTGVTIFPVTQIFGKNLMMFLIWSLN